MKAAAAPHPGYRACAGVALVNAVGEVFLGRRRRERGNAPLDGREWQMPQGGIDEGEDPHEAVMSELWEETGAVSAEHLGETDWMTYEFPP